MHSVFWAICSNLLPTRGVEIWIEMHFKANTHTLFLHSTGFVLHLVGGHAGPLSKSCKLMRTIATRARKGTWWCDVDRKGRSRWSRSAVWTYKPAWRNVWGCRLSWSDGQRCAKIRALLLHVETWATLLNTEKQLYLLYRQIIQLRDEMRTSNTLLGVFKSSGSWIFALICGKKKIKWWCWIVELWSINPVCMIQDD